jgi:CheY-like chemotaxis protein
MMKPLGTLKGKPILLVEDDYHAATALASSLRQWGADVVGPSPNINDALKKIRETRDLAGVVLDVNLGGEMVFPVADELDRRGIPFLFATGYEPNIIPVRFSDKIVLRKPLEDEATIAALLSTTSPLSASRDDALTNGILRLLPQHRLAELLPHLRKLHLPRGALLETTNQVVERVLFPVDCVLSLTTVGAAGTRVDTAFVGNEGMTGSGIVVGDNKATYDLINRVEGDVLAISAADFRIAMETGPTLRLITSRYERSICVQIGHAALVTGQFDIPTRLARWFLMIQDRSGKASLDVTHDTVAGSLGVRRPSVTAAMHFLEGELLIRSTRSNVLIRDRDGLVRFAGEAYGTPEAEHRRLMALPALGAPAGHPTKPRASIPEGRHVPESGYLAACDHDCR